MDNNPAQEKKFGENTEEKTGINDKLFTRTQPPPPPPPPPAQLGINSSGLPKRETENQMTGIQKDIGNLEKDHDESMGSTKVPPTTIQDTSSSTIQQQQKASAPQAPSKDISGEQSTSGLSSPSEVLTTSHKKGSKFKIIIVILVVITILVYAVVAYLYFSNKNEKGSSEQDVSLLPPVEEFVTPTPSFRKEQIGIINGSIYNSLPSGENKLLVNKEDYPDTGITGFLKVIVSPNDQKICFESWSPSPSPALYTSSIDGSDVIQIAKDSKNCRWLSDSNKIIYVNTAKDTSPVDIYMYDFIKGEEINITQQYAQDGFIRYYETSEINDEKTAILCRYDEVAESDTSQSISEGFCQIDILTGEYSDITL